MNPFVVADFERTILGGCAYPDCKDHSGHDVLFLHSRCHMEESVVKLTPISRVLHVGCGVCGQAIVSVLLAEDQILPPELSHCCDKPFSVSYEKGSGALSYHCTGCLEKKYEIAVSK